MEPTTLQTSTIITAEDKLLYLKDLLQPIFSKILVAIIILLIGFTIGKFLKRLVQRLLAELELNSMIRRFFDRRMLVEEFISSLVGVAIYVVTILTVLEVLGLSALVMKILTVGVLVIMIALAILTVKDFLPNLIAWLTIHRKEHIDKGTIIEIEHCKGTVKETSWNDVEIETEQGDVLHIPNSLFIKKTFKTLQPK